MPRTLAALIGAMLVAVACAKRAAPPRHADFARYFTNGTVDGAAIKVVDAGSVVVPTGSIVVADPFYLTDAFTAPLRRQIPPGTYPVRLSVARIETWGERVAFARLEVSNKPVVRWELAETSASGISKDSFGVDAGLACILDAETAKRFASALRRFDKDHPKGNYYEDVLSRDIPGNANWGSHRPEPGSPLNAIVMSSGLGDGVYSSYWGFDAEGKVAQLVIDFQLFDSEA